MLPNTDKNDWERLHDELARFDQSAKRPLGAVPNPEWVKFDLTVLKSSEGNANPSQSK